MPRRSGGRTIGWRFASTQIKRPPGTRSHSTDRIRCGVASCGVDGRGGGWVVVRISAKALELSPPPSAPSPHTHRPNLESSSLINDGCGTPKGVSLYYCCMPDDAFPGQLSTTSIVRTPDALFGADTLLAARYRASTVGPAGG